MKIGELVSHLSTNKTILFLGAGASVPSGGPITSDLCKHIENEVLGGKTTSTDFAELCSIVESKYGRLPLVEAVKSRLSKIRPTRGMMVLPKLGWDSIYTTNFDTAVEIAYRAAGKPLIAIRSNFDMSKLHSTDGTPLFKIHGCIKKDRSFGDKSSMVLSERDFDEYDDYRETLFQRLASDMSVKDILFVGYSLGDPHLRAEVKKLARLHKNKGAPGRFYMLCFEGDEDRLRLMEMKGISPVVGGIDDLMDALAGEHEHLGPVDQVAAEGVNLPLRIQAATVDVAHEVGLGANPEKLFNGFPATYADVSHNLTFSRTVENTVREYLLSNNNSIVLTGVAGVGKTTVARRIAVEFSKDGFHVWEHSQNFPLRQTDWQAVELTLRTTGQKGLLVIDDCPAYLSQINKLVEYLSTIESPSLRLLLVSETSQWEPRKKSSRLFRNGAILTMSALDRYEIDGLLNLVSNHSAIQKLVSKSFALLTRDRQRDHVSKRCSSDMFVSLKNIFGYESLDTIILREYGALPEHLQELYRMVSALEAADTKVHRQLVLKLTQTEGNYLIGALQILDGIIDEYDVKPEDGLYAWRTRHKVISEIVTKYKFSDADDHLQLMTDLIECCNPTIWMEERTLVSICMSEFGISRIPSPERRLDLYFRIAERIPYHRVPRHRIIRQLLSMRKYDEAEIQIRAAVDEVGKDSPIYRYSSLVLLSRAQHTIGIRLEDRKAMVQSALNIAHKSVEQYGDDKYSYRTLATIAQYWHKLTGDRSEFDHAVRLMTDASQQIADPDYHRILSDFEDIQLALGR